LLHPAIDKHARRGKVKQRANNVTSFLRARR